MNSFNIWHWFIVLSVVFVLFGGGLGRRLFYGEANGMLANKGWFTLLIFCMGALTSAVAVLIGVVSGRGKSLPDAVDIIMTQLNVYFVVFVAAGVTWVVLGYCIGRLRAPRSIAGLLVQVIVVSVLANPVTQAIQIAFNIILLGASPPPRSYLEDPGSWFHFLEVAPYNIVAFIRAAILVTLVSASRKARLGSASGGARRWPPAPMSGSGADQVTRILCGNALLAGAAFRRRVLAFFEDKWIATAPEFGLDTHLLARVCADAEARDKAYGYVFAAIGVVGLIIIAVIPPVGLPLTILVAGCVWFSKGRKEKSLARMFGQASFNRTHVTRRFNHEIDREVAQALPREDQNLVVYRGFMPFVGVGLDLGGWSFVTFVDKPKVKGAGNTVRTFNVQELYAALDEGIQKLQMPNLRCRDYFFVRGLDIKSDPEILGDLAERPRQVISDDLGALYMEEQDTRIRHYKCIQVIDWGGEIIVSYYLRCSLQSTSLLVEMKRFLLPPLANEYRLVDRLGHDRFGLRVGQFIVACFAGPLLSLFAPLLVFAQWQEAISKAFSSHERQAEHRRQAAQDDPSYDYGAATTLRTAFAQNSFLHYFQKSDADFDNKLIERKILDDIELFLDRHGIDTADIRDRQTTILNSGILVQGGDVRAESLAVGTGAQANKVETQRSTQTKETA